MCGIFGIALAETSIICKTTFKKTITNLFKISESRGKEASGLAILNKNEIHIYKDSLSASKLIGEKSFKQVIDDVVVNNNHIIQNLPIAAIGQSRLVTNGFQGLDKNNQPLNKNGIVGVHNGIVVNVNKLWGKYSELNRETEVDTEIILALISKRLDSGKSLPTAISEMFSNIVGETSIALVFEKFDTLALATNTGSIYYALDPNKKILIFASEEIMLKKMKKNHGWIIENRIFKVAAGNTLLINLNSLTLTAYSMQIEPGFATKYDDSLVVPKRTISDKNQKNDVLLSNIRRCTKCILPDTVPFIQFNSDGICNFCLSYKKHELGTKNEVESLFDKYRKNNGKHDCIVAFSGGRDSSYGLHCLKKEYGMNPIAFSYDWGMITDLARRNQARMCGKLGIEHIWISANIKAKRENIKANINAWMKQPRLGMIPLLMAGDKQFFYYANKLMKQLNIKLMILCENALEKTTFKTGFAGVSPMHGEKSVSRQTFGRKLNLAYYYVSQFLRNPSYLNKSIVDTIFAYCSYYFLKHDYLKLYDYKKWDESEINRVLIKEYDWETAADTHSTWRIGDGTAPLYNYIYFNVAGFTEFDTFRSNQIREGILTREEALNFVLEENKPRYEAIREYTQLVGVDFNQLMRVVHSIPKLYTK